MKRLLSWEHELVSDVVLNINEHIVSMGVVEMIDLLQWHSVNKTLSRLWSDRDYLIQLITKAGEKSLELFEKEKHGFYLDNDRRLFLYRQIFPMVDLLFSEIINHIKVDKLNKTDEYLYRSVRDNDGKVLSLDRLIPVALYRCQADVLKILSEYMQCKCGWEVVIEQDTDQRYLSDFMNGASQSPHVYLRPVTKRYNTKVPRK